MQYGTLHERCSVVIISRVKPVCSVCGLWQLWMAVYNFVWWKITKKRCFYVTNAHICTSSNHSRTVLGPLVSITAEFAALDTVRDAPWSRKHVSTNFIWTGKEERTCFLHSWGKRERASHWNRLFFMYIVSKLFPLCLLHLQQTHQCLSSCVFWTTVHTQCVVTAAVGNKNKLTKMCSSSEG